MQGPVYVGTQSGILVIAQNQRHAAASVYAENCPYRTGHRGMGKLRQVYEIETNQLYELKPGSWAWAHCKYVPFFYPISLFLGWFTKKIARAGLLYARQDVCPLQAARRRK